MKAVVVDVTEGHSVGEPTMESMGAWLDSGRKPPWRLTQ